MDGRGGGGERGRTARRDNYEGLRVVRAWMGVCGCMCRMMRVPGDPPLTQPHRRCVPTPLFPSSTTTAATSPTHPAGAHLGGRVERDEEQVGLVGVVGAVVRVVDEALVEVHLGALVQVVRELAAVADQLAERQQVVLGREVVDVDLQVDAVGDVARGEAVPRDNADAGEEEEHRLARPPPVERPAAPPPAAAQPAQHPAPLAVVALHPRRRGRRRACVAHCEVASKSTSCLEVLLFFVTGN